MNSMTATEARNNIYRLMEAVETHHKPVHIIGKHANAVLVSASDWSAIEETLYLVSIPGMRERIRKGLKTPLNDCDTDIRW